VRLHQIIIVEVIAQLLLKYLKATLALMLEFFIFLAFFRPIQITNKVSPLPMRLHLLVYRIFRRSSAHRHVLVMFYLLRRKVMQITVDSGHHSFTKRLGEDLALASLFDDFFFKEKTAQLLTILLIDTCAYFLLGMCLVRGWHRIAP
jgi:hypothetical protein